MIPKIKLSSGVEDFPYIITRKQFPVRLCFAITINKSQGQSFLYVGVDLQKPVFSHGQFYVAISRATDVRNISICLPGPEERYRRLTNIIYLEVLI
jgi:ATP-dependent exoDNAse (exonuclease V) alpha subunit